jgi:hypothetical protein
MKNFKGFSPAIVGVLIALFLGMGFVAYKAGEMQLFSPSEEVNDFNIEVGGDLERIDLGDNPVNPINPVAPECLTVTNIIPGQTVSFPLEINGTIGYGCWGIFEGEAGFAHIEQNGQMLSQPSVNSGLVRVTSGYYTEADYPAGFTANIPSVNGEVNGPANLVITERGDLGENGNPNPDQVIIPISLGSGVQGNQSSAQNALVSYFQDLNSGDYGSAVQYHGSGYEVLQSWNPDLGVASDPEILLQRGCEINGWQCLEIHSVVSATQISNTDTLFVVKFQTSDGGIFEQGACCGAPQIGDPVSEFEYTVRSTSGGHTVLNSPVYTP